jgi:hypothetical protein
MVDAAEQTRVTTAPRTQSRPRPLRWALNRFRHRSAHEEMDEVRGLILAKLGSGATAAHREFLDYRFKRRYLHAVDEAPWFGRGAGMLKIVAAICGFVSAGIVGLNENLGTDAEVTVIVLGVLVGALTTIDQTWKPGVRHANLRQTENQLLKEGWDFALERGRYKQATDVDDAFRTFVGEVCRVTQSERSGLEQSIT